MRKRGLPERNEMVVCEITRVNPNSAYAKLLEYGTSGMIHVSEIAKRWIKDIRQFVKERQIVVCRVTRIEDNYISLSIKRVNKNQADRRLQEFKREKNAEKFLEQVGKQFKKKLDETYDEIGYELTDTFGSLYKTFDIALKNPDLLKEKNIDKKWADAIIETAKKNFVEKTYEIKGKMKLTSYAPDGMDVIKNALLDAAGKGFDVKYISAPKYQITGKGKDIKRTREDVEHVCEEVVNAVENADGEASFTLEGN